LCIHWLQTLEMRCGNKRKLTIWQFVIVQNKLTSVFHSSDLLFCNEISHNIVEVVTDILTLFRVYDEIHDQQQDRRMKKLRQYLLGGILAHGNFCTGRTSVARVELLLNCDRPRVVGFCSGNPRRAELFMLCKLGKETRREWFLAARARPSHIATLATLGKERDCSQSRTAMTAGQYSP